MKEGWKYCRLGEVGTIITGSTPSTKNADNYSSKDFCFVKPSDILKEGITSINDTESYLSRKGYEVSRKLPKGSVLTTCIGIIGKVGILNMEATCNQQINAIIPSNKILSRYLALAILSKRTHLENMANAPVVPIINKGDFSDVTIPVPPLEQQQQIVSELDLLSGIIEKQKKQLKELDTLAQSIFYDMFGDPIDNKNGFDVKAIKKIGNVERGAGISKKDFVNSGLPCIHYGQLHTSFGAFTTSHISSISADLLQKPKIAHKGDLIMAITSEDVECSCKSTAWMGDYDVIIGSDAAILHHNQNGIYLSYCTRTKSFNIEKSKYAKGFKVTHISATEIEQIPILVPPLPLQQEFACKIEAIEHQKETISKSIGETQRLFDYTMDKYFG